MTISKFFSIPDDLYPNPSEDELATWFFHGLWTKLHVLNFSLLISLFGQHRTGKSLAGVSFAHILDETFAPELESRVVYDSVSLTEVFRDLRRRDIKGGAVIIDECGSGDLGASRWFESISRTLGAELQSVGYLSPLILFISQNYLFLNSTVRRLSQGIFEVKRKNALWSTIKPLWVSQTPFQTSAHRTYPVCCLQTEDGYPSTVLKLNKLRIGLPPKDLVDRYIAHSQSWKDSLLESSVVEVSALNGERFKRKPAMTDINSIVSKVLVDPGKFTTASMQKGTKTFVSKELIRHQFGIPLKDASLVKMIVDQAAMKKMKKDVVD
jgi:hypothetical protein